ncbi:MAG TPA: aminotransferase class IV [Flavisolibacter sp.]|nr:aminotransferase class IV [Flavisolibacter sp.]
MADWAFINDQFFPEDKAMLHFRDLAIQRGYGVFDFLRFARGEPVFIEDHLQRFYFSASRMHLPIRFRMEELKEIIKSLIKKNKDKEGGIRLTLTGGYSPDGYQLALPNLIISQHNFVAPSPEQVNSGIRLITHPFQRQFPEAKTIDYAMAIWLQPMLKQKGADDIIYHHDEKITECPRSNFFMITEDQKLVTPEHNILKGITRMKVLELAAEEFETEERTVTLRELNNIREAFITSTTKGVLPVTRINQKMLPYGPVTKRLRDIVGKETEKAFR